MHLLATVATALAMLPPGTPPQTAVGPPSLAPQSPSRALGTPTDGRLRAGVLVPEQGTDHFTWDPILRQAPNREERRWATSETVARTLRVIAEFRAAHPGAPRIGVGDLSRPRGGVFDRRFGGLGHASHQNGLDVDVYYPRTDGLERAPRSTGQVDRTLAQDLVNRFSRAGARYVFMGPNLRLRRLRRSVMPLVHHDDHLHVRFVDGG